MYSFKKYNAYTLLARNFTSRNLSYTYTSVALFTAKTEENNVNIQ